MLYTDPRDKVELINNQFQYVVIKSGSTSNSVPEGEPYPKIKDLNISTEGVCKLIKDIKLPNARDAGCIPNMVLRELTEEIAPVNQNLFTQGLKDGALPSNWQNANISSLPDRTYLLTTDQTSVSH